MRTTIHRSEIRSFYCTCNGVGSYDEQFFIEELGNVIEARVKVDDPLLI